MKSPSEVELYTDSNYLRGGITGWIKGWKKNGWRTADRKPVKNAELWEELDKAASRHDIRWHWVKGHHGHDENERADELARARHGALHARAPRQEEQRRGLRRRWIEFPLSRE